MAGEPLAREGVAYGHPRVIVARQPNGPVVLHDLRGSDEQIHRIRFVIGAATVAGLVLLAITSENLRRLEENEPYTPFWLGFFALSLIVMAGMALRYHAGWEEISLSPGLLQVRLRTGVASEPPVFFDLARIRRLQVEYDTLRYGGDWYRVQIAGKDGQGLLPADGLLTGIRTYDEALALVFAIAHHFDLTAVPGLHPSSNPAYRSAPQPVARSAPSPPVDPAATIELTQTENGTSVTFRDHPGDFLEWVFMLFIASFGVLGGSAMLVGMSMTFTEGNSLLFGALGFIFVFMVDLGFLYGLLYAGRQALRARVENHVVLTIAGEMLHCRRLPLPPPPLPQRLWSRPVDYPDPIPLANLRCLAFPEIFLEFPSLEMDPASRYQLVARLVQGKDVRILTTNAAAAAPLAEALHQHLGLPVSPFTGSSTDGT